MGRLLLQVEATAHRHGWDEAADLYVLYDWHEQGTEQQFRRMFASALGPPVRCGRYAAQVISPEGGLDGFASHALFRMAVNLKHSDHPDVAAFAGFLRWPGFRGVAMRGESWRREDTQEGRDALGEVRFADVPGSQECRNVFAADVDGVVYLVDRVRGCKPRLAMAEPGAPDRFVGAVVESLHVIVAVVAGRPPPDLVNVPSGWRWEDQG